MAEASPDDEEGGGGRHMNRLAKLTSPTSDDVADGIAQGVT